MFSGSTFLKLHVCCCRGCSPGNFHSLMIKQINSFGTKISRKVIVDKQKIKLNRNEGRMKGKKLKP